MIHYAIPTGHIYECPKAEVLEIRAEATILVTSLERTSDEDIDQ